MRRFQLLFHLKKRYKTVTYKINEKPIVQISGPLQFKLYKASGNVEKIRHYVKNGLDRVTFYVDNTLIAIEENEQIPLENGDDVLVVGNKSNKGVITPIIFQNSTRDVRIVRGNIKLGKVVSALLILIGLLYGSYAVYQDAYLYTAFPVVLFLFGGFKIMRGTRRLKAALNIANQPSLCEKAG